MYSMPLLHTTFAFSTNAVINTNTTDALIGAPGVGSRIRVIGYHATARRTTTGLIDALMQDTSGTNFDTWSLAAALVDAGAVIYPFPGIQLLENRGVQQVTTATVASQLGRITVYYVVDSTT